MAFTMHSHSGQFCPGHAKDSLEAVVQHAIAVGYTTMGLTEHMPRTAVSDLYPEELLDDAEGGGDPEAAVAILMPRHEAYLSEATRLQNLYADQIELIVGFEGEFIRAEAYVELVRSLAADERVEYFIGSLHHALGVPIDFDREFYAEAVRKAEDQSEEKLWEAYYDQQHEMLASLKPRIVGHFDLIRLMSSDPARDTRLWKGVWDRVRRNLEVVRGYGGWLECNTSALRKGLEEPYPKREIAELWLGMGGKFTMSDDSHGIAQVATNYRRGLAYLESLGVEEVWTFERIPTASTETSSGEKVKATLRDKSVSLAAFAAGLKIE